MPAAGRLKEQKEAAGESRTETSLFLRASDWQRGVQPADISEARGWGGGLSGGAGLSPRGRSLVLLYPRPLWPLPGSVTLGPGGRPQMLGTQAARPPGPGGLCPDGSAARAASLPGEAGGGSPRVSPQGRSRAWFTAHTGCAVGPPGPSTRTQADIERARSVAWHCWPASCRAPGAGRPVLPPRGHCGRG